MADARSSSTLSEPSKVAAVTFGFWVIKVLATTLGETGGDWVSMSLDLGYLVGSAIFAAIFVALVWSQVKASRFRPALFWATIVATTTLGTTMADFADRSLGIGYPGGVAIVASLLARAFWSGRGPKAGCPWRTSTRRRRNGSTGARSCFPRRWEQRSATGWRARIVAASGLATSTARSSSGRARSRGGALLLDDGLAHGPLLGRLHIDAATRRHAGRPARQARRERWTSLQPLGGLARLAREHRRLHRLHPAACSQARRCGMTAGAAKAPGRAVKSDGAAANDPSGCRRRLSGSRPVWRRRSAWPFVATSRGILERLSGRQDITLVTLPEGLRKDAAARAVAINDCDVAVLCLPDEAARQAVASIRNPRVRVIDASSAHRTDADWVYGFPEMSPQQSARIAQALRVSNPGCYPTGAVALLRPLVEAGCLRNDAPLSIHAVSGYSGRGREGIEAHEGPGAATALSFQTYGLDLRAADKTPVSVAPFSMRVEPVTEGEFRRFVLAHPQWRRDRVARTFAAAGYLRSWRGPETIADPSGEQAPVVEVSWFAAQAYCESEGARLPTWSRVGIRRRRRRDPSRCARRSGVADAHPRLVRAPRRSAAAAVGGCSANVYGVRDLHGLVWEWVDDFNALLVDADSREQRRPRQAQVLRRRRLSTCRTARTTRC